MQRDFTFIDDIVDGILRVLEKPPVVNDGYVPHNLYNLGNAKPEKLTDFIGIIEATVGRKAVYDFQPLQPGDVPSTCADIAESTVDLGFVPKISIADGIPRFVSWYKKYHHV